MRCGSMCTVSKQSTSSLHSRSQNLPQAWQKHSRGYCIWRPCLFASVVEVCVCYEFSCRGQTVNQFICVTPFTGTSVKETSETLAERQLVSSPQHCSFTYINHSASRSFSQKTELHWLHSQPPSLQQTLHVP